MNRRFGKPFGMQVLLAASMLALAAGAAQAADKLVYMNDWLPGGDKALPFYAKQKGLFAAQGIDLTVQTARGSSEAITRIATGSADVGSGGFAALLEARAQSKVPVSAIYSVFTVQPDALFTVEGGGVKSIKDVEGRKVATATFTSSNVIWPLVLKTNGIDASKVTLIKVDPAALVPMLATARVDATINWSTAAPPFVKALAASGKKLKILPWKDFGFSGYGYSIYASDKLIAEKPDVVRRFVAAFDKGMRMALANPADVAKSMKATFPEMDQDLIEQQFMTIVPLIKNAISEADGYGTFKPARVAETWKWTAQAQNMPLDKLNPQAVIVSRFLPKN
jgi:NitT/TauT family transport system substrate-binding protein